MHRHSQTTIGRGRTETQNTMTIISFDGEIIGEILEITNGWYKLNGLEFPATNIYHAALKCCYDKDNNKIACIQ